MIRAFANPSPACTPYGRNGTAIRWLYLVFAAIWWVLTGFGRLGGRGRVIVLCYHCVTSAQRVRFARQMARIARRTIGIDQLGSAWQGRTLQPGVCVTFDDGFASLLENALPAMHDLGMPATVFIVTGNLGQSPRWVMPAGHPERNEPLMTAEQVAQAVRLGLFRAGSHTVSHPALTDLPTGVLRHELTHSKATLSQIIGHEVEDLALPHGAENTMVMAAATECGYRRVFTLDPQAYDPATQERRISRFKMSPDVWPLEFYLTCAGAYAWLAPWRRLARRVRKLRMPGTRGIPATT